MILIDKEQAQKMLLDLVSRVHFRGACFAGIRDAYQSAAERLDTLPVVEERKHGQWKVEPYLLEKTGCCSICGEQIRMPHGIYKYCPNCGAIMDGETK